MGNDTAGYGRFTALITPAIISWLGELTTRATEQLRPAPTGSDR